MRHETVYILWKRRFCKRSAAIPASPAYAE